MLETILEKLKVIAENEWYCDNCQKYYKKPTFAPLSKKYYCLFCKNDLTFEATRNQYSKLAQEILNLFNEIADLHQCLSQRGS